MTDTTRQWHEMTRISGSKRGEIEEKCTYYYMNTSLFDSLEFGTLKIKGCLMVIPLKGCLIETRLYILIHNYLILFRII